MSFKNRKLKFAVFAILFVVVLAMLSAWIAEVYVDSQVISWRTPGWGDVIPHAPGGTRSLRVNGRTFPHVLGDKPGFLKIDGLNAVLFVQLPPGKSAQCNLFILDSGKLVSFGGTAELLGYSIGRKSAKIGVVPLKERGFQVTFENLSGEKITYEFDIIAGVINRK